MRMTSGMVMTSPSIPQMLQGGNPGDGGTGCTTGATGEAVTGAMVGPGVGDTDGVVVCGVPPTMQPHTLANAGTAGHRTGSMKPLSPARWKLLHVKGCSPGTMTRAPGMVMR